MINYILCTQKQAAIPFPFPLLLPLFPPLRAPYSPFDRSCSRGHCQNFGPPSICPYLPYSPCPLSLLSLIIPITCSLLHRSIPPLFPASSQPLRLLSISKYLLPALLSPWPPSHRQMISSGPAGKSSRDDDPSAGRKPRMVRTDRIDRMTGWFRMVRESNVIFDGDQGGRFRIK